MLTKPQGTNIWRKNCDALFYIYPTHAVISRLTSRDFACMLCPG